MTMLYRSPPLLPLSVVTSTLPGPGSGIRVLGPVPCEDLSCYSSAGGGQRGTTSQVPIPAPGSLKAQTILTAMIDLGCRQLGCPFQQTNGPPPQKGARRLSVPWREMHRCFFEAVAAVRGLLYFDHGLLRTELRAPT